MQQRGVQDVHGDAAGPRQPELLAQPRQAPDTQEAPLTDLLTLKATYKFKFPSKEPSPYICDLDRGTPRRKTRGRAIRPPSRLPRFPPP